MKSFLCHKCGSDSKYQLGNSDLCESCYTDELAKEFDRLQVQVYREKCDRELGVIV